MPPLYETPEEKAIQESILAGTNTINQSDIQVQQNIKDASYITGVTNVNPYVALDYKAPVETPVTTTPEQAKASEDAVTQYNTSLADANALNKYYTSIASPVSAVDKLSTTNKITGVTKNYIGGDSGITGSLTSEEATKRFGTQPVELTPEQKQQRINDLSNAVYTMKNKEYQATQKLRTSAFAKTGLMDSRQARQAVASKNFNATPDELDNVQNVIEVLAGQKEGSLTSDQIAMARSSLSNTGTPNRSGKTNITGTTQEMNRTVMTLDRVIKDKVTQGTNQVKAVLSGATPPTNFTEYNALLKRVGGPLSQVVREQTLPLLPKSMLLSKNLDEANIPSLNGWLKSNGYTGSEIDLNTLQSNSWAREKMDEMLQEKPIGSFYDTGNGQIAEYKPTKAILDADGNQIGSENVSYSAGRGVSPDISNPLAQQVYRDRYGAANNLSLADATNSFDVSRVYGKNLQGEAIVSYSKGATGKIADAIVKQFNESELPNYDKILQRNLEIAKEQGLISGLDSDKAYAQVAREITKDVQSRAMKNVSNADAVARQSFEKELAPIRQLTQVDKNGKVVVNSDFLPDSRDYSKYLVNPKDNKVYASEQLFPKAHTGVAGQVLIDTLNLDRSSNAGRYLSHAMDLKPNELAVADPKLYRAWTAVNGQLASQASKLHYAETQALNTEIQKQEAQNAFVKANWQGNADSFTNTNSLIFKKDEYGRPKPMAYMPSAESSIATTRRNTLQDTADISELPDVRKNAVLSLAGTKTAAGTFNGSQVNTIGASDQRLNNSLLTLDMFNGKDAELQSKGYINIPLVNSFSALSPKLIVDSKTGQTRTEYPTFEALSNSDYAKGIPYFNMKTTSPETMNMFNSAMHNQSGTPDIQQAKAAMMIARKEWIEGNMNTITQSELGMHQDLNVPADKDLIKVIDAVEKQGNVEKINFIIDKTDAWVKGEMKNAISSLSKPDEKVPNNISEKIEYAKKLSDRLISLRNNYRLSEDLVYKTYSDIL